MDEVRAAAGRLAARGEVDITQGGRVVDIAAARGTGADPPAPARLMLRVASLAQRLLPGQATLAEQAVGEVVAGGALAGARR